MTVVERMVLSTRPGNWVANVHRFVRSRDVAEEQCELCSAPIATDHRHLVEPAKRRLLCVCRGCATLLGNRDDNRHRAVPEYAQRLENFHTGLRSSFTARQTNVSLLFILDLLALRNRSWTCRHGRNSSPTTPSLLN
jgi:hypothetical protein